MMIIASSMSHLLAVYTYQFDGFEFLWENYLGIDKNMQKIIGLRRYRTKELLLELFYLTFLVVITAIQMLVFHANYINHYSRNFTRNNTNSRENPTGRFESNDQNGLDNEDADKTYFETAIRGITRFVGVNKKLLDWVCLFLELQFFKVVLALGFLMSIYEISALNMVMNILVLFACSFEDVIPKLSSGVISLVAGVVIIFKMIFKFLNIPETLLDVLCIDNDDKETSLGPMNFCNSTKTAQWLGVYYPNTEPSLIQFLGIYLIFVAVATFFSTILYYQKRRRCSKSKTPGRPKVLFNNVTREDANRSVILMIKYFFNHGFFNFGIEITLVTMAILISFRQDIMSVVYIFWLCLMLNARRQTKQFIWPIFQYFVTFAAIAQYFVASNLPPFLQINFQNVFEVIQSIESLLQLKNSQHKLLFDFLLLMCVCRQQNVFEIEMKNGVKEFASQKEFQAGAVRIIITDDSSEQPHDFVHPTNWVDILKCIVYFSSFWLTLSVVLLTGTNNLSAFSLGYLVSSFLFCYIGTNFYMKPLKSILYIWYLLIGYNIFVIAIKSIFNLRLIINGTFLSHPVVVSVHRFLSEEKKTTTPFELNYDCLCFAFLILQLRIFKSPDFSNIISDSRATFACDSRGTQLLADRMQEMHTAQKQREKETLESVKQKVERIKANQRKFEPNLIAAKTHHEAVRYNGKYLYEELVEKAEFDPRKNESPIDLEESYLFHNRSQMVNQFMNESRTLYECGNRTLDKDTGAEINENNHQRSYLASICHDFLISITLYLYKLSRNYRYVHEILREEKKLLKVKLCGGCVDREKPDFFSYQHSVLSEFLQAIWFAVIANTDVICYLCIFSNTVLSMNTSALPMSLLVCIWATLTLPRPSKRFWLTVIAYTEGMIFVQYFLQIISHFHKIEIAKPNATCNMTLLHVVLFHRSVLKHMGVWTYTKKKTNDAIHALRLLNMNSSKSSTERSSVVQIPADVYTLMFLCDLINFFVLMFGFAAFSQSPYDGGVGKYFREDQIPFRFLLTLLVQFMSLIIDRALYLRRNMKGKILFHILSVIVLHIWQFHFMNMFHQRPNHIFTWPPMLFYFIKCVYFLLSAYQIRCGYPKRVSGNFASNGFSLIHWRVSELYQTIPFLPEARTLLDWVCIKTSLSLYEWFKMEDIFSAMFIIKCHRQYEKSVQRTRGIVRGSRGDYMRAFFSLVVFFVLIWGPWALFTFDHTVGKSNVPYEVSVSLHIGSTEPFYRMTAQTSEIHQFTEIDFGALKGLYANNTGVQSFLSHYEEEDIAAISLERNSTSLWGVSPPSYRKFIGHLNSNATVKIRYSIAISRLSHKQLSDTVEFNQNIFLTKNDSARQKLSSILSGENGNPTADENQCIYLPSVFPKFLKVMNSNEVQPIPQFSSHSDEMIVRRNITLCLHKSDGLQWWELIEDCTGASDEENLSKLSYADCKNSNIFYTFNDKLYPSSVSGLIGNGIIGLYSTYILLTSKFFRKFLASKVSEIVREDLPYVDRILQLCSDIYLVREQREFQLEEDLYAKLIFLYRSPETMIRWTRMPEVENTVDGTHDIDESDAEKALRKSLYLTV